MTKRNVLDYVVIESLLHVLLVTGAGLAADSVELVNKDNSGLLFPHHHK